MRTVHRIWLGGPEPEWLRGFAETWRRPGWDLRQWTDENVGELFPLANQAIYDAAEEIAPDHVGQLRSDVLRYEILFRFGGVYVDADFECLRPIDDLIDGVRCFAAWEEPGRWIANGFIGAAIGHPFIARLIAELPANVRRRRGSRPNKLSGPQFLTRLWRRHGRGVRIFDRDLFYPFGWREIADFEPGSIDPAAHWPEAVACHWWANKRREAACSTAP